MATRSYKNPPEMRDDLLYSDWKKELSIWEDFTELAKNKQGPAVYLTLKGKARETVLAEVDIKKIKTDNGVKVITDILDTLFLKNEAESAFSSFDSFIKFRRPATMSIKDYVIEFNLRMKKASSHDMTIADSVQAYFLLSCANLSPEQTSLCRATCKKLSFADMKEQIERVSMVPEPNKHQNIQLSTSDVSANVQVEFMADTPGDHAYEQYYDYDFPRAEEPAVNYDYDYLSNSTHEYDAYYGRQNTRASRPQQYRGRGRGRGVSKNRPDEFGNPTVCRFCKSVYHWIEDCPHAPEHVKRTPRGNQRGDSNYRGSDGYRGASARARGGSSTQYYF